jgi:pimeloyl-ACP methyl ester carboxylesterase
MSSLAEDVRVARDAVDELARETGRDVVLAGHSYGGIVLSAQAVGAPLFHLVFLAAVVAAADESIVDAVNADPAEPSALAAVTEVVEGWMRPLPGPIAEVLYHDCSPDETSRAVSMLRPQTLECVTAKSPAARWQTVHSTYLVCEEDRALPPSVQRRMAQRAHAATVSVPPGHSVFYTNPELVAELLVRLARD